MALIRGTIYKLSDDEGYFYFGSTIQTLSDRFKAHKHNSKNTNSKLYQHFTYEKFCQNYIKIEVVEEVVVEKEIELRGIENQYITRYRNDLKILNTYRSSLTKQEVKDYNKQWRDAHKEYKKKYYDDHKEEIKQNRNKRYIEQKEQLKEILTCECGVQITKRCLTRHIKSQYHKDFMDKKTIF